MKAKVDAPAARPVSVPAPASTLGRYRAVRAATERFCAPLHKEDFVVQSATCASPTKWHIAHTTWFFETFILEPRVAGYRSPDDRYNFLFNSYYNGVGPQHERDCRGMITRPTVEETFAYRRHVDGAMADLLADESRVDDELRDLVEIGLHHEQQHQELMAADLKHALSLNPLKPAYTDDLPPGGAGPGDAGWIGFEGGLVEVGHDGRGFAYDHEAPRHKVYLRPYALASRPVTCAEYMRFIDDGGYRRAELWLDTGWQTVRREGWTAPLYWRRQDDSWWAFTLSGERPVDPREPVCHLSYFEADAYARWAGARLPTEHEWETAAAGLDPLDGRFADSSPIHPAVADPGARLRQMFGGVWEWTSSAYGPYPGYRPPAGAIGEYNGKFMCNQYVLRGGSCATPPGHIRPTYRNFFDPEARWQFAGVRLAQDA